jgi:glucose-1-phosphate cytidylyltransferase
MKAVILAGGLGTRIAEESDLRPKPMVEIGGKPILWHIMKMYSNHGVKDFIVLLGYRGYMIKEYFFNYYRHTSDFKIDLGTGEYEILNTESENWTITFVDSGLETQTGGRLKRAVPYLENETFCLTYGDGVSDINISAEIAFHQKHGKLATVAAVKPPGRFATLTTDADDCVSSFKEKPEDEVGWINGGFFVLEPRVLEFIADDSSIWERGPLESIVAEGQLMSFKHTGFWKAMDTLRDQRELDALARSEIVPWLSKPQGNQV